MVTLVKKFFVFVRFKKEFFRRNDSQFIDHDECDVYSKRNQNTQKRTFVLSRHLFISPRD